MLADTVNSWVYYCNSVFVFLFAVPFFYIVLFKTPPSIRLYRNTILSLTTWYCVAAGAFGILLQPIHTALSNKSCAKFAGIASLLGGSFEVAALFMATISFPNVMVATSICFIYRYVQIRGKSVLLTSNGGALMAVVLHLLMTIFGGCVAYVVVTFAEIVSIDGYLYLCFGQSNYSAMQKVAVVLVVVFGSVNAVSTLFALLTIKVLRSQKALMSKQTYRLHLLLTLNLIIVLMLPLIFAVTPSLIGLVMIYRRSHSIYLWISLAGHGPFLDLILTFVATIGFIRPYRDEVKRIFHKH
ncbi:hypothetical protein QR680_016419 [Steinernema hermaphroditum]|uniref:Uncharacterized protein n=1 Tax=Steinernema hermaphroditum TaxID=289476 RepID=A0AA39HC51_9BILA|nr:hypothetical protein QR680_016417 [Steinernema hermaphroditum]KAK0402588.1 hypothetical protein QR680_016419 [Steinernema hermaphroditum]